MDRNNKCLHLRFNLADKEELELWDWLHSEALAYQKSLNAFMIWELNHLRNSNASCNNGEDIADKIADRILERLSDKAILTSVCESDDKQKNNNSYAYAGTETQSIVNEPVESSISDDVMDFMNGF